MIDYTCLNVRVILNISLRLSLSLFRICFRIRFLGILLSKAFFLSSSAFFHIVQTCSGDAGCVSFSSLRVALFFLFPFFFPFLGWVGG